jgi:MSHA pilin protein MshD
MTTVCVYRHWDLLMREFVSNSSVCSFAGRNCRGATLVELVITIVLMSLVLVAIASTLSFSSSRSADLLYQVKLVELGQAYLEEILTKRFDENSPLGGVPACSPSTVACGAIGLEEAGRTQFDDVDDYHLLNESPPLDPDGIVRQNYVGYRVDVQVAYVTEAQRTALVLDEVTDAKLIRVTIVPPTGSSLEFSAYKGNF